MMLSVIYTSRAATAFDQQELAALLGLSQANNERDGLTGHLVHVYGEDPDDAWFAQLLEGEAEPLEATLARISADELHHDLRVLAREPVTTRMFPGWSMRLDILDHPGTTDLPALMRSREAVTGLLTRTGPAGRA